MAKKSDPFSHSNYCLFLKLLKKDCRNFSRKGPAFKYKNSIHCRYWIPPPCLSSSPQQCQESCKNFPEPDFLTNISPSSLHRMEKGKCLHQRSKINEQRAPGKPNEDGVGCQLSQLKKERELLKEAQLMVELGESLSPSVKALVHKWKMFIAEPQDVTPPGIMFPPKFAMQENGSQNNSNHKSISQVDAACKHSDRSQKLTSNLALLQDLGRSFKESKDEEKRLELELRSLQKETRMRGSKKPSVKLRKSSASHDYKHLALRRKYEDLRQYLMQVERETGQLRKENQVLHSALKEQNQSSFMERLEYLETEIAKRDGYIKDCEKQMRKSRTLYEENHRLKELAQDLEAKMEQATQHKSTPQQETQEELQAGQKFEEEWLNKLTHMKLLYEKAISGYKDELSTAGEIRKSLETRLQSLVKFYEEKQEQLISDYESRIKVLKLDGISKLPSTDLKDNKYQDDKRVLRSSEILQDQKKEMKEALELSKQHLVQEKFQEEILSKLEELLKKPSLASVDVAGIATFIKETLDAFLDEIHESGVEKERRYYAEINKKDLEDAKKEIEKLTSKCALLESKACKDIEVGQNLEVLSDLPHLLKETQGSLSNLQNEYQTLLMENKVLEERFKNHSSELTAKQQRITELEGSLEEISVVSKKWEREAEALETKVDHLQSQVAKKNDILEKNSLQLEERIREYATISSQLEKLRDDHNREISTLKALNRDSQTEAQLREVEARNICLEGQLSFLRTEKTNSEKTFKKQVRFLEEQLKQLKIKNLTLQKNLETIQTTYQSMFSVEGLAWPTSSFGLLSREVMFDAQDKAK